MKISVSYVLESQWLGRFPAGSFCEPSLKTDGVLTLSTNVNAKMAMVLSHVPLNVSKSGTRDYQCNIFGRKIFSERNMDRRLKVHGLVPRVSSSISHSEYVFLET